MGNEHAASNVWSFNHRVHVGYFSDSDSENGSEAEPNVSNSNDVGLAQEMDLSVRQETVEYRPNPWSIAKINAASRSTLPRPTALGPRPLDKAPPSPKPQPKRIIEAFKKQAERGERRNGQPVVSEARKAEKPFVVLAQHECGRPAAKAGKGGMVRAHNAAPVADPEPKAVAHNTIQPVETPAKQKSAHISIFSGRRAETKPAAPLFKSTRVFRTPHESKRPLIQSSPVRQRSPMGRPRIVLAQRESPVISATLPVIHHSSPGPRPIPHTARGMRPPPVSIPVSSNSGSAKIATDPLNAMGKSDSAALPTWLSAALDEGIKSTSPAPELDTHPKPSNDVPERTRIATPEPKRKRPSSPPPITQSKKARSTVSAYTFGEDLDPDATWSTLASRSTGRKGVSTKLAEKPRAMAQSGCFRLPIPGLMQKMVKKVPQTTTTTTTLVQAPDVKRRVITYLPPPMATRRPTEDASTKNQEARECESAVSPERDVDEEQDAEIRVMDSDEVTLVNDDEGEVMVKYDVDDVCAVYRETRASMKELRRMRKLIPCVVELAE